MIDQPGGAGNGPSDMSKYPAQLAATVRHLHQLLADRQYEELEAISGGKRLSAENIAKAIGAYGSRVVDPPKALKLDVVKMASRPGSWAVSVDIWTEEGRSDLSLELTLTETDGPLCSVEIDNLHVL